MSLLERVATLLRRAEIPFALIGASAMAAYGAPRSTVDQDLLTVEASCLQGGMWSDLAVSEVEVEVRKGDFSDPLAGVVRFSAPGERPVDLVVGKLTWQRKVIERAAAGAGIPIVRAADLILLKLYAGGPQDAWDVHQLLGGGDRQALIAEVEKEISQLSAEPAALWRKIVTQ